MQNKLQEEGEKNKEKISSASLPLVEHFGLVLKRKSSYSCGLGIKGITSKSQIKSQILAEAEAAKKRASDLNEEVARLTEVTKKQEEEIQAQRVAIEKQATEIKHVSSIFAQLENTGLIPNLLTNASAANDDLSNDTTSSVPTSHVSIQSYKILNVY